MSHIHLLLAGLPAKLPGSDSLQAWVSTIADKLENITSTCPATIKALNLQPVGFYSCWEQHPPL